MWFLRKKSHWKEEGKAVKWSSLALSFERVLQISLAYSFTTLISASSEKDGVKHD